MRYVIATFLSILTVSIATAKTPSVVILDGFTGTISFQQDPLFGTCPQPGVATCRLAAAVRCTASGCARYTQSGRREARGGSATEFHPRGQALSALDLAPNINVIVITGVNNATSQSAFNWIKDNADRYNIVAVSETTLGFTSELEELSTVYNIVPVVSAGNFRKNGFAPASTNPYKPNNTFEISGSAASPYTIAAGAGFNGLGNNSTPKAECRAAISGNGDPVPFPYQVTCYSNAPDDPNTSANYYVADGCVPGFDHNDLGFACGTSFSAPRLAGMIGEIRNVAPYASFSNIINYLDNSGEGFAPGFEGRQYKRMKKPDGAVEYARENYIEQTPLVIEASYQLVRDGRVQGLGGLMILHDFSQSSSDIVHRAWKFSDEDFTRVRNQSISLQRSFSDLRALPEFVTLTVRNQTGEQGSKKILLNQPKSVASCGVTIGPDGSKNHWCYRIVGSDGDDQPSLKAPTINAEFVGCRYNAARYVLDANYYGTVMEFEFQMSTNNGPWINVGHTRTIPYFVNINGIASRKVRVRALTGAGYTPWGAESFRSRSCSFAGGLPF